MDENKPSPKRMSEERFVQDISENYRVGVRYCFILGSGASFRSGIPTGQKMMQDWRNELLKSESKYPGFIKESALAAGIGLSDGEYERLFEAEDYQVKSEDYFTFYDIRYEGKAPVAYRYLQDIMVKAKPSFGYYALSEFLVKTENKLVITTNFDTLTEDTIYFSQLQHPLVLGHESLAAYLGQSENVGRPVVAKVHRDLFYQPMNTKQEMEKLADQWEAPLRNALSNYVPIVIGYGGGDRTLMTLLDKLHLRGLYWCVMRNGETDRISELVEKQKGYLVSIRGFDQIILKLVTYFSGDDNWQYVHPTENIRQAEEDRIKRYNDSYNELLKGEPTKKPPIPWKEVTIAEVTGEKPAGFSGETVDDIRFEEEDRKEIREDLTLLESKQPENAESRLRQLRLDAENAHESGNEAEALNCCEEAISLAPDDPELYELRSDILYKMGKKGEALSATNNAIELWIKEYKEQEKDIAWGLNKRATDMWIIHRVKEARLYCKASITTSQDLTIKELSFFLDAILAENLGDYQGALDSINATVEISPLSVENLKRRIHIYELLGLKEKANQDKNKIRQIEKM